MLSTMIGLDDLRTTGRMTWTEPERGWIAAPEEIVEAVADAVDPQGTPREPGGCAQGQHRG